MVFTTQIFLFIFFPIMIFSYWVICLIENINKYTKYLLKRLRIKEIILIIFSMMFYMATAFSNGYRLFVYIVIVYLLGVSIQYIKLKGYYINIYKLEDSAKKIYLSLFLLVFFISIITFCLIYFNYYNFIVICWNKLFMDNLSMKSLVAPLGISFLTFSAISYIVDIYRGNATSGSLIDCMLFLSFFPKIISGPIILWKDFQAQINNISIPLNMNIEGINRIMIGFAKKVILADSFGVCLNLISLTNVDRITAIGGVFLYMLQIYYDFSGYSDIAIGISYLLGFKVKENFNFPYRSISISEFWRRWHISLGTWFREYIYIPLGGSHGSLNKTLRNLAIVFALTGIWHGAGFNYILWGGINAIFAIAERLFRNNTYYIKTPKIIKYVITMIVVMFFWQLFRFESLSDVYKVFANIFGNIKTNIPYTWQYYFDLRIIFFVLLGILGATLFGSPKLKLLYNRIIITKIGYIIQEIILIILFFVSVLFMVNSKYSPFIYFQY